MKENTYGYSSKVEKLEDVTATVFDSDCDGLEVGKLFVKYTISTYKEEDGTVKESIVVKGIPTDAVKQYVKQYPKHHWRIESDKETYFMNGEFDRFVKVEGKTGVVFSSIKQTSSKGCCEKEDSKEKIPQIKKGEMVPEIIISSDGEKVVEAKRVVEVNGEWEVVGKGVSRCHPLDKFSLKEGTKQALKRLFGGMEKEETSKENAKTEAVSLYYKGDFKGYAGKETKFVDAFNSSIHFKTGDQVQVLCANKSVKGVIGEGYIITNDEIIHAETKVYITLIKEWFEVERNSVFAGVVYE